ncbi:MAG TPA: hypothetical protein PLR16_01935 [Bacilli bacterium]|nr:hypothetical protein [Bacilli bacterium]HPX84026.1 hypothetical protein [Bacilli bacterium]
MTTDDKMIVHCVWEHNKNDSLVYSSNVIGAFTVVLQKKKFWERWSTRLSRIFFRRGKFRRLPLK